LYFLTTFEELTMIAIDDFFVNHFLS